MWFQQSRALDVDTLLVDIFYHFNYRVKRKEIFREYQEFCGSEMQKVIKHASTRWLSLQKCAGRTISQWQALKSYFVSYEDVEKPGRVKKIALLLQETENYLICYFCIIFSGPLTNLTLYFRVKYLTFRYFTVK